MEKQCKKCHQVKPLEEFHKAKGCKDGRRGSCKTCFHQASKARNRNKAEEVRAYKRRWYAENKNKIAEYNSRRDPEAKKASQRKWRQANLSTAAAATARYNASKMARTPAWLTEDHHWMIAEAYELSAHRSKVTGVPHEVVHVVPLLGQAATQVSHLSITRTA